MTLVGYGWREPWEGVEPSGQDHLGLAAPIDYLARALTPGITNVTRRARYLTFLPWMYWRFARLGGQATAKEQAEYTRGMEMLFAYANIAAGDGGGEIPAQIIRRFGAKPLWDAGEDPLPLRTAGIAATPSRWSRPSTARRSSASVSSRGTSGAR